jgi:predicted Zn finger-like uncharacterized protein
MRFVCDSCRAQYMISDDKIGAKGVKIRCKKCGHVIVVRPNGAAAPKDGSSAASAPETAAAASSNGAMGSGAAGVASLGSPPEGGLFTDVEEDEIGAVFDQVLNSGSQKIPSGESVEQARESKPSTPEAVRKLAAAESEPDEPKAAPPANDWFVAIDEKQVGPLTVEKIKEHWDRGEVGPDSLCWRAGFSDWIPLSEATELASVLAPRPAKPVIVAPAAMAASSTSAPEAVESAFSAGASAKSNRPEIPAAPALGKEPPSSGWKPSAASVLASLVKEETEALTKPPPKPAAEEKPAAPGLLDLPPPEPALAPAARAAPMMAAAAAAEQMRAPQPAAMPYAPMAPAPAYAQPAPAYAQPAYAPAGYPQPAYSGYPPGAVPGQQGGNNKMIVVAAIAAGAVVLAVVGGIFIFRDSPSQPSENPAIAAVNTPPQQATRAPEAAPPPQPEAKAQEPAPAPAVANPSAPAAPDAAAPAPVPAAGVAAGGTPAAPAVTPTPPPPTTPAPPAASEAVAKATPGTQTGSGTRRPTEASRPSTSPRPEPAVARPASSKSSSDEGEGDDFDDLFGTGKKSGKQSGEKTPSTYIPPEPGSASSNTLERLGQSDIMSVVVANKPAIVKCVNEQKKQQPGLTGKLVMRWTIQTNGRTSGVAVRSEEFKKTYMANCISGLIKGWTFPKHKKQGEPIDFPFTF